jgi:hypothetical protein
MNNTNPKTGVAYGYISANALDLNMVVDLMAGVGADNFRNVSEDQAVAEIAAEQRRGVNESGNQAFIRVFEKMSDDEIFDGLARLGMVDMDRLISPEVIVSGVYEGVHYTSSWLGGALHFFIMESPVITGKAGRASPCVPGAGILDDLSGNVVAYDVPLDWRADQTVRVW